MALPHLPEHFAKMIETIFPEHLPGPAELDARYPPRALGKGAMVTRVGPSPTGPMHIGTLYVGLLSERFAHRTGGVFFLRVEDTDKKREVAGATDFLCEAFDHFRIAFDEGRNLGGEEVGNYGPYTQSKRILIYRTYIKELLRAGLAYPCFCTAEDLEEIRSLQQAKGVRPGYYGEWAVWRDRSDEDISESFAKGTPYVIRFKSTGDAARRITFDDLVVGQRTMPENDQDIVIMKSDRLPTYHLAHVVDDHLMGTTHVIRGDEWLASLPIHLQLFDALGWIPPTYAHVAPINKLVGSSRRKLSKRKDPEASVRFFIELGYPPEALIEYLLNLANSNFEDWRKENPQEDYRNFPLSFDKLRNSSGPLFDFTKLDNISRDVVARFSTAELQSRVNEWARIYDPTFAAMLEQNADYTRRILDIERSGPKARKDVSKWADVKPEIDFFFDDWFGLTFGQAMASLDGIPAEEVRGIIEDFMESYRDADAQEQWFDKVKAVARKRGFAEKMSDYKKMPTDFKGTVADVAKVLRVILTGKAKSPDLYAVMRAMGPDRVRARMSIARRADT